MNDLPASPPRDDAMMEADQVVQGYTVSFRDRCLTRIGAAFVMRDGGRRCVRLPVAITDTLALGRKWAEFSRPANESASPPANEIKDTPGASSTARRGTVNPKDASLVLQGYTSSTHGVCLVRVVGHYVTRDGVRRHIRFLVDTVDPVLLGAAWAVFGGTAGWVRAASGIAVEILNQPVADWADTDEERLASD
jgi:hypothetical protein